MGIKMEFIILNYYTTFEIWRSITENSGGLYSWFLKKKVTSWEKHAKTVGLGRGGQQN